MAAANVNKMSVFDFLIDDYEHNKSVDCYYITTRIPGPGAPEDIDYAMRRNCMCVDNCSSKCLCQVNLSNYKQTINGHKVLLGEGLLLNNRPIIECNELCTCWEKLASVKGDRKLLIEACLNRCVQFGPVSGLDIFPTARKGLGIRTTHLILQHEFICEYAGEVIGQPEAEARIDANKIKNEMNYVFILFEHTVKGPSTATCIDPSKFGNIGRYINHSCEPNAMVVPVRISSPVPHLCIFAKNNIHPGEEITFDYGGGSDPGVVAESICYCGTAACRGRLPGTLK